LGTEAVALVLAAAKDSFAGPYSCWQKCSVQQTVVELC